MHKFLSFIAVVFLAIGITMFRDTPALTFAYDVLQPINIAVSEDVYSVATKQYITLHSTHSLIPQKKDNAMILLPHTLSAVSILAKDVESGTLLYEKNAYESHSLASLSKLMSALVLREKNIVWDTTAVVSPDAIIDNHMYAGDTYTLRDLWHAALIGSSNKAIVSLIDATGWTREQFIARMNEKALELGMSDTHFFGPTGLNEDNVGTASDIALLLHNALQDPLIKEALLMSEYELFSPERNQKHHMWNTNWLLLNWVKSDLQLVGGKTGYIVRSGYNFAVEVTNDDGVAIDVVVLGSANNEARFSEARDVANWVFDTYTWE